MKAPRRGRNGRGARYAPPGCRPSSRIYTPARPRRASHTPDAQASCSCACVLGCPRACAGEDASCEGCLVRAVKGGARSVFEAPTGCAAREPERGAEGGRADGDHAGGRGVRKRGPMPYARGAVDVAVCEHSRAGGQEGGVARDWGE
jgi:hypothetical protein